MPFPWNSFAPLYIVSICSSNRLYCCSNDPSPWLASNSSSQVLFSLILRCRSALRISSCLRYVSYSCAKRCG